VLPNSDASNTSTRRYDTQTTSAQRSTHPPPPTVCPYPPNTKHLQHSSRLPCLSNPLFSNRSPSHIPHPTSHIPQPRPTISFPTLQKIFLPFVPKQHIPTQVSMDERDCVLSIYKWQFHPSFLSFFLSFFFDITAPRSIAQHLFNPHAHANRNPHPQTSPSLYTSHPHPHPHTLLSFPPLSSSTPNLLL